ncbi:AmpG family muropeptide MFS transporter [Shewanella sp. OPT22]|nr:AmpG family muropeptide MFS transporter [Shewanella sp. OPT22]
MALLSRLSDMLSVYAQKRVVSILFLGFSSGLPLMLVFSTLSFWLREAGVDRTAIGYFSWIALVYGFKWLWSPLVDRLRIPIIGKRFGQRRSWILIAQFALFFAILGMSFSDPVENIKHLAICAFIVAFASTTQDIVIDAFRIESAPEKMQAALSAAYLVGYRSAMIIATAGALTIAAWIEPGNDAYNLHAWQVSYQIMAGLMIVGVIATLLSKEPQVDKTEITENQIQLQQKYRQQFPKTMADFMAWFHQACVTPFVAFFKRYGKHAILILVLISCYRISDIVMGIMANVFYVDMGFSKEEIAAISKVFGIIMTLVGAAAGGLLTARYGIMKILFLGAVLVIFTNALFAIQAVVGHNVPLLTAIISVDNFSQGIAISAFIAYLSSLTSSGYSATQYALLSSVMQLFPKFIAGFSGAYVDSFGYVNFFIASSVIGIPVLFLIYFASKVQKAEDS